MQALPAFAEPPPDGLRLRGGLSYLKGRDIPYVAQDLELAWRYPAWRGRFELGLVYGLGFPVGGVPGGRPTTELEAAVLDGQTSSLAPPLGLRSLQALQLRSRFFFFDPGSGPWGLEPFTSVQLGVFFGPTPGAVGLVLPSFGLGVDWWITQRFALSPALYVPFWIGPGANPQFQAELAVKVSF